MHSSLQLPFCGAAVHVVDTKFKAQCVDSSMAGFVTVPFSNRLSCVVLFSCCICTGPVQHVYTSIKVFTGHSMSTILLIQGPKKGCRTGADACPVSLLSRKQIA